MRQTDRVCVFRFYPPGILRRVWLLPYISQYPVPSTQYPEYLTLAITSLDNPDAVAPTYHIHTESQLPWLPIQDEHPRYPKGK